MRIDHEIANAFKALAHPRRARLFRLLAECPESGRSFSALQAATGLSPTSLVHHLREMERGGLIRRVRKGNEVAHLLTTGRVTKAASEVARLSVVARSPKHAA